MQLAVKTEILGDQALIATIRLANVACQECINIGLQNKTWNKTKLHHLTYQNIRQKYPMLNSSLVTAIRDQASNMLKHLKLKRKPTKKLYSGIRLNHNTLKVYTGSGNVSLSTIEGRKKYKITIPAYFSKKYIIHDVTAGILFSKRGKVFLNLIVDVEIPPKKEIVNIMGIDRGIYHPAVTSNNLFFNSNQIRAVKGRYMYLKSCLQKTGTHSAKRHLIKLAGRERRFISDVNHCISKKIVNSDFDTIALEELNVATMKMRTKRGKKSKMSRLLGSWSPTQLLNYIRYKSELAGKNIVLVNSHYTSQACSVCGDIRKSNRNGRTFKCAVCGFELHSDLNASRNIAYLAKGKISRPTVNRPNVTYDELKASYRDELRESIVASSASLMRSS